MSKIVLKRLPEEDVWYNFSEEIDEEYYFFVLGRKAYNNYGQNEALLEMALEGRLDEMMTELNATFKKGTMHGYCQGEVVDIVYSPEYIDDETIKYYEALYFGNINEYRVESDDSDTYRVLVPHYIEWDGKDAICKFVGVNPEETTILIPKRNVEYTYEEM